MALSREEHIKRHKELHKMLDDLVADWIEHNYEIGKKSLDNTSIMELMMWSSTQIDNPTESRYDKEQDTDNKETE